MTAKLDTKTLSQFDVPQISDWAAETQQWAGQTQADPASDWGGAPRQAGW